MIIDGRRIHSAEALEADVCIVGGGPAAITIALELRNLDCRVLLLESGDFQPNKQSQLLSEGIVTGVPYHSLESCRLRCLGGTTNSWGGWCRPLDAIDFEQRISIRHSGWPISKQDLMAEYTRAQQICGLGPYHYDAKDWTSDREEGLFAQDCNNFCDSVFQVGPLRFGEAYRPALRHSSNIRVLLGATVLELESDELGATVKLARVGTWSGNRYSVRARVFVLAVGGIENARILLNSRTVCRKGLGNDHDVVGRYFADHLHRPIGVLAIRDDKLRFYERRNVNGTNTRGVIGITDHLRRTAGLLGFGVTFHNADDPHDVLSPAQRRGYHALISMARAVKRGTVPDDFLRDITTVISDLDTTLWMLYRRIHKPARTRLIVGCRAEKAPNPSSRVELGMSKDRFGMPMPRLAWRITHQDLDSLRTSQKLFRNELELRSMNIISWDSIPELEAYEPVSGAHHIGTTRMHADPKFGVVDSNCRIHTLSNLYLAGSSVFPTGGWATPTLTIVALALRLADHLKIALRRGAFAG
jgi:choline dehydrogenase-like flavoprotein